MWVCERCGYSTRQKSHLSRHLNYVKKCEPNIRDIDRTIILEKIKGKRINAVISQSECESKLKELYQEFGATALICSWLCDHGHRKLYDIYSHSDGCSLQKLTKKWGIYDEWKVAKQIYRKQRPPDVVNKEKPIWTSQKIDETMKFIIKKYGFLPPSGFIDDELGNLRKFHAALYNNGGLEYYKEKYAIIDRLRNYDVLKRRFRSFPEAALSNWLISKQIIPDMGEKYPQSYKEFSGKSAWYDMHFWSPILRIKVNIEIWGGPGKNSPGSEIYIKQKEDKISFHGNDITFMHLNYEKCFDLAYLELLFMPYIGMRPIYNDVNKHVFDPTKWSLSEELLVKGKDICSHFSNGLLPTTTWFSRKDNHLGRVIEPWEPNTWGGFMDDVNKIGGIGKLLMLLGQKEYTKYTNRITKSETLIGIQDIYEKYGKTIKALSQRNDNTDELRNRIKSLISGVKLHFNDNMNDVYKELGIHIKPHTKTGGAEGVIKTLQEFYQKYERKPSGLVKTLSNKKNRTDEEEYLRKYAVTLVSNCQLYFPKYSDALIASGIE